MYLLLFFIALSTICAIGAWIDEHTNPKGNIRMNEFVEYLEGILPADWEVYDPEMGSSCLLLCPHGTVIEQDGHCPEGCESPMLSLGMI